MNEVIPFTNKIFIILKSELIYFNISFLTVHQLQNRGSNYLHFKSVSYPLKYA